MTPPTIATAGEKVTRFQVRDGVHLIDCVVSNEALEAASGLTAPSTATSRRQSFDRHRMLINAAAKLKLRTLPPKVTGALVLTGSDLRRVPPEVGLPAFGSSAPQSNRPKPGIEHVPDTGGAGIVDSGVLMPGAVQTAASVGSQPLTTRAIAFGPSDDVPDGDR